MSEGNGDPALTQLLGRLSRADGSVHPERVGELFQQLRAIAGRQMQGDGKQHTLQPTALVNEAYLKLFGMGARAWNDRHHFFRVAATAMRQILVDHARRKQAQKRAPAHNGLDLDQIITEYEDRSTQLLDLDAAIAKLEQIDERAARAVDLRFFAGRTMQEAAAIEGVSERTFGRDLDFAKAFLLRELGGGRTQD